MRRVAGMIGVLILTAAMAASEVTLRVLPDGTQVMSNSGRSSARVAARTGGVNGKSLDPRWAVERRVDLDEVIDRYSVEADLDPALVHAVIQAESAYNPRARSSKGAMGLMQLMPGTARDLAVTDPYDVEQNVDGGTRYLRQMLELFDERLDWALAAYNAGPEAVSRHQGVPPYSETEAYVDRILETYYGEEPPARRDRVSRGRRVFLTRDSDGALLMTTSRPR